MSAEYPVLDNRPINKWKVAELKEELKRRNLTTKGLKDDLVKRLDEAIRYERAAIAAADGKGEEGEGMFFDGRSESVGNHRGAVVESGSVQMVDETSEHGRNEVVKIDDGSTKIDQGKASEQEKTVGRDAVTMIGDPAAVEAPMSKSNIQDDVLSHNISNEGKVSNKTVILDDAVHESFQEDVVSVCEPGNLEATEQSVGEVLDTRVQETLEEKNIKMLNNEVELRDLSPEKAVENIEVKPDDLSLKSSEMDADRSEPYSSDQVHEVSHNLGVKSESFSNDALTINEKNELKKNLTADNVQLEPESVRPEMVQPSSSRDTPGDGIIHPLDDPVPHDNQALDDKTDDDKPKNLEFSKNNDNVDEMSVAVLAVEHNLDNEAMEKVEYDNELNQMSVEKDIGPVSGLSPKHIESSAIEKVDVAVSVEEAKPQGDNDFSNTTNGAELPEKVNFDQSSADESMEEDALETRHVDSDHNSSKVDEKTEHGEDVRVDVGPDISPSEKFGSSNEHKDNFAALSEKRKFQDAIEPESKEVPKRQRRWNYGSQEAPGSQSPGAILSPKPKPSLLTGSTKSSLTRSVSTLDGEAPKERVVPPSQKAPTTSLRIDQFLRPFTLKAVQELLAKTGEVVSFWMDHIKTHCYVTYPSVEEAIETRNAVYDLQWPPNGGRHLIADFVEPEEVKLRMEGPPQSATPTSNANTVAVAAQPPPPPSPPVHQQGAKEHREPQHPLSRQLSIRDRLTTREPLPRAPSPVLEKPEPPIVTLDDLFRKTRATPRIYYLPLSDEQVAAKLARQKGERQ